MAKAHHLDEIKNEFNAGCTFFQDAVKAWQSGELNHIAEYETALRKAAREVNVALEWALKAYLRKRCPEGTADYPKLKNPNFYDLMQLMKRRAGS